MTDTRMVACTTVDGGQIMLPASRLVVRPSAYAVILHGGQVALITNFHSGRYYLPGGGVEQGERLLEGLRREIHEEVGLEVDDERFVHFAEDFFYYDPLDAAFHALQFYYACRPTTFALSNHPAVNDAEGDPQWVALDQLTAASFHSHGTRLMHVISRAVSSAT